MTATMPKPVPSTVELDPPGALLSTLSLGGYQARVVVSREDGQPMTEADRQQAERLIEASEHRGLSDEEIARRGQAYLDGQAAKGKASSKALKPSPKAGPGKGKASAKGRDAKPGKRAPRAAE